jgi:SCP-2 sterol transfer family
VRYLSPDWMAAAGRALAGDEALAAALAGLHLTIDQVVTGCPGGEVAWRVAVGDGGVRMTPLTQPPAGDTPADLRFTTDYRTAAATAAGEIGAQRAFVEGRLRVGGDLSLLIAHQRALGAVDDALAKVRAETTY